MLTPKVEEYLFSKSKDPNLFTLGRLCKYKHDDDDKESIRYVSTGNCLRCQDKYYFDNCEKILAKYHKNK